MFSVGHEESIHPSVEYIPTQQEINSYELMFEEDRPKFIPKEYACTFLWTSYVITVKYMFLGFY